LHDLDGLAQRVDRGFAAAALWRAGEDEILPLPRNVIHRIEARFAQLRAI
jgi:hypothetical protein